MVTRRAVYTAMFGRYEELHEQPVAAGSAARFICFTDDPDLRSDSWEIRQTTPLLQLDPVRSARALKITGHADLAAYAETLWIDARVVLRVDPDEILDSWLDETDVAFPKHSFRADVVSEFDAVLQGGLDDFSRLYEQLTHYAAWAPERLDDQVPWTGMVARRHGPDVARGMAEWLLHVLRYSRRDQLSVVHTLAAAGVPWRAVELDNDNSPVHDWHLPRGRSTRSHLVRISDSLRAPVARVGELSNEVDRLTAAVEHERAAGAARVRALEADHADLVGARDLHIAALQERVAVLGAEGDLLRERLATGQERLRRVRARLRALRDPGT